MLFFCHVVPPRIGQRTFCHVVPQQFEGTQFIKLGGEAHSVTPDSDKAKTDFPNLPTGKNKLKNRQPQQVVHFMKTAGREIRGTRKR